MSDRAVAPLKTVEEFLGFKKPLPWAVEPLRDVKRGEPDDPKILFCLDMMGGSVEDRFIHGSCGKSDSYRFHHWQLINSFVYYSYHLVTIPPPGWISAGHRHGIKVLGTFTLEAATGAKVLSKIRRANLVSTVASQLAHIAASCKFDGWLMNISSEMVETCGPFLLEFLRTATMETHCSVPGSLVIWYDSVLLDRHNELNEKNSCFFNLCDGIFLNFGWTDEMLQKSAGHAGSRKNDVYVGTNVFARNTTYFGGYEAVKAVEAARKHGLSSAIFASGWTYETQDEKESAANQCRFWDFLECSCPEWRVRTLPLRTSFCQGFGEKLFKAGEVASSMAWSDLSQQQLQPRDQGLSLCDGCGVAEVCTERAYNGGGCLLLRFIPDVAKPRTSPYFRLFACDIPLGSLNVSYTFQMYLGCSEKIDITLVLMVRMASGEKRKLLLGVTVFMPEGEECEAMQDVSADCDPDTALHGWQTRKFQVNDTNSVPNAVLEEIGISFLSFDSSVAGACLLGELFIERTADKPADKSSRSSSSKEGLVTSNHKHVTSTEQNRRGGKHHVRTCVTTHSKEENGKSKHKGKKLQRYSHCTNGFTRKSEPVVHLHTGKGDRRYRCDRCGRDFLSKCHLVRHQRTHSGERPYRCEYCSHGFQQQAHLVSHLRIHTGERPYHCEYCSCSFSQHGHLTTHLRIHTGDRPFQCEYCNCSFSRKGHLTGHLQRMHKRPS